MLLSPSNSIRIDALDESNASPRGSTGFGARAIERVGYFFAHHGGVCIPLVLAVLCLPIWFSLGDHGFNGRSGARYGVVSQEMSASDDWIVPRFLGHPHLTKPPLIYWAEAGSIELFGQSYYAVRLPSAISGTLVIVLLYWFASRVFDRRTGLFACALYAIMPMTIMPARMTVTDSMLNLWWAGAICAGYFVQAEPKHRRWRVLFWVAVSMGMLTKGPVMLIPLGMILLWWWGCRGLRFRIRGALRTLVLTLLSMVPVLAWATIVGLEQPDAVRIWLHETLDRAAGNGDHARPIWFFIPVLLVGCFPASAMLILPGVNLSLRRAWSRVRDGSVEGYLGWSILAPFLVYSLISGKLPSYLLPICLPLALLSARVLVRWCDEAHPARDGGTKLPEVRWGLMIGTLLYLVGGGVAISFFYGPEHLGWLWGLTLAGLISVGLVRFWGRQRVRQVLLASFLGAWIVGWIGLEEVEDLVLKDTSYIATAQEAFGKGGWEGAVGTYRLNDAMILWDQRGAVRPFTSPDEIREWLGTHPDEPMLLLTTGSSWDAMKQLDPEVYARGRIERQWYQWPGAPKRYLVVFNPPIP